jgi:hypothetical protein
MKYRLVYMLHLSKLRICILTDMLWKPSKPFNLSEYSFVIEQAKESTLHIPLLLSQLVKLQNNSRTHEITLWVSTVLQLTCSMALVLKVVKATFFLTSPTDNMFCCFHFQKDLIRITGKTNLRYQQQRQLQS